MCVRAFERMRAVMSIQVSTYDTAHYIISRAGQNRINTHRI